MLLVLTNVYNQFIMEQCLHLVAFIVSYGNKDDLLLSHAK